MYVLQKRTETTCNTNVFRFVRDTSAHNLIETLLVNLEMSTFLLHAGVV